MPPTNDKANPNVAMTEANAMESWQQEGLDPNYVPYLAKDVFGNDIAEPDRSNPTRSRHERPLDTIRSFEAAAYGKEYSVGGVDGVSEVGGLQRGYSRQSMATDARRTPNRNSSTSYQSQMQRNYSYGNMQDHFVDDNGSEIQAGPSRDAQHGRAHEQPSASGWDSRTGYGSPVSDSGRAQFTAPMPQKLNYTTPPTPPQEIKAEKEKKKSWGKRLSFGKNKA